MISRVIIDKKLLASFRKRTLEAYPREAMCTMWGRVEGDTVLITVIKDILQKATENEVNYYEADALAHAGHGDHYLGSIHSHPDCLDATPSQADWDTSFSSGERVFAVMQIRKLATGRFKTEVKFWEPRPEITIVYPRVRDANRNKQQAESKAVQVLQEVSREDIT